MNSHEDFSRQHQPEGSSDRSFGLVFTVFFLVVGLIPLLHRRPPRWWALAAAAVALLISLVRPALLHPANLLWTRLGLLMFRVVNPVVMGIMFYLVITPLSLLMRIWKKDPLKLDYDPNASSYWIRRDPPGPDPATMSRQF